MTDYQVIKEFWLALVLVPKPTLLTLFSSWIRNNKFQNSGTEKSCRYVNPYTLYLKYCVSRFKLHWMHKMQTIVTDVCSVWPSVCLSWGSTTSCHRHLSVLYSTHQYETITYHRKIHNKWQYEDWKNAYHNTPGKWHCCSFHAISSNLVWKH